MVRLKKILHRKAGPAFLLQTRPREKETKFLMLIIKF